MLNIFPIKLNKMYTRFTNKQPEDLQYSYHPVTLATIEDGNYKDTNFNRRKDNNKGKVKTKSKSKQKLRTREADEHEEQQMHERGNEEMNNEELLGELCDLLAQQNVQHNMNGNLYNRVERVLAMAKQNHNKMVLHEKRPALKEICNNNIIQGKFQQQEPIKLINQQDSQEIQSKFCGKINDFYPCNTFSIEKGPNRVQKLQTEIKQQKQKTIHNESSNKTIKPSKSVKTLGQNKTHKVHAFVLGQKSGKLKPIGEERKPNVKSQAKKSQVISRNLSSLNVTAFTTRNVNINSKSKQKDNVRSKSKGKMIQLSNQSTGKLSKFHNSLQGFRKGNNLQRHYTEQDYQHIIIGNLDEDDEELFSNHRQKQQRTNTQPQKSSSLQFLDQIYQMQTSIQSQEQQLNQIIRGLKMDVANEKSLTSSLNYSICSLKKECNEFQTNNLSIQQKKKQLHKKLQHTWNEVKGLNNNISQIKKQNQQVVANIYQEKQLLQMYHKVIEEIKQQLKIENEEKDQYKRLLKQNKKLENVSRIKSNTHKEKNEIIMGHVRDSINKWIL